MEPNKTFCFDKVTVFFIHTDYQGYVHPYNYFEWMSYARESFFQTLVPNFLELCDRNIKMVTHKAELELLKDAVFGDQIVINIYAEHVKRLSFDVVFEFLRKNDGLVIGTGRQRLTFLDAEKERPAKIPEELKEIVFIYEKKEVRASS